MIIELNGSYGVVTLKVKNADGSVQEVPNVDILKLRDELGAAPIQRADEVLPDGSVKKQSTEEEMSAMYMAILATHGVKDTGSTLPGIFISNEVVAAKEQLLKKFDANAEVHIVD